MIWVEGDECKLLFHDINIGVENVINAVCNNINRVCASGYYTWQGSKSVLPIQITPSSQGSEDPPKPLQGGSKTPCTLQKYHSP